MPPGRPPKRTGELSELDSPDGQAKCKISRLDRPAPNDFSSVVKSKLQSYTRTGQACDRCKVRKIRCDALPEGCSHCINQNLECYVTDRVTGRTERRGYMQELEREKTDMLNHIRALEKLLTSNGVDVKPWQWSTYRSTGYPPEVVFDSAGNPISESLGGGGGGGGGNSSHDGSTHDGSGNGGGSNGSVGSIGSITVNTAAKDAPKEQWARQSLSPPWSRPKTIPSKLPIAIISQSNELKGTYARLGVGNDKAPLSSIKGTTLSILGSTIDVNAFEVSDIDDQPPNAAARTPLYNKSLQAMIQTALNVNPPLHVEYPPKADAFTYAEWYFLMIYPFLPVLHKPTFLNLLTRLYEDPSFVPTIAETVMVHMVYASIYMQYAIRQEQTAQKSRLHEMSNNHYHFALSKYFDLISGRSFADLQALTMIALHTSRFPKTDSSHMITAYALGMAVELGLHRSTRRPGQGTDLENEMRKRIFWCLTATATVNAGRMGRPMPLRLEECDVEFPEPIADELLSNDGVDTSRTLKCPYEVGVASHKMSALFLEMYANVYTARRDPRRYLPVIEALEEQLQAWKDGLPESLKIDSIDHAEHEGHMFALYMKYLYCEFRLCLRHPSVALTSDPRVMADNTRICEETAGDMLRVLQGLFRLKCLDTTWYCLAVYIAAVFTILAAHWERRYDATAAEVQALRENMGSWLVILTETGNLMGCGLSPRDAVSSVVDRTIAWIEHDRIHKGGAASVPPPAPPISQEMIKNSPRSPSYTTLPGGVPSRTPSQAGESLGPPPANHGLTTPRNSYYAEHAHESSAYQHGQPVHYSDSATHSPPNGPYDPNGQYLYAQTAGHGGHVSASQARTQPHVAPPTRPHSSIANFNGQPQASTADMMWRFQVSQAGASVSGHTWQDWTAAVVDSQDRYSASALMSLGGSGGPRAPHSESMSESMPAGDLGIPVNVGVNGVNGVSSVSNVNGVNGAGGSSVPTTSSNMQWPLLLFSDPTGAGS